jgi:hypothetical protein
VVVDDGRDIAPNSKGALALPLPMHSIFMAWKLQRADAASVSGSERPGHAGGERFFERILAFDRAADVANVSALGTAQEA